MNLKTLIPLLLGVAAGALYWMHGSAVQMRLEGGPQVDIVTAAHDLPKGKRLEDLDFAISSVPEGYRHPQSIAPADRALYLRSQITNGAKQGQPLLKTDFDFRNGLGGERMSALRRGLRAIAISPEQAGPIASMLRPGDHVDVLGTFSPGNTNDMVTATVLQNLAVLSTAGATTGNEQRPGSASTRPTSIALLVEPYQAEILTFALQRSRVSLSLRSSDDSQRVEQLGVVRFQDIVQINPPPVAAPPRH